MEKAFELSKCQIFYACVGEFFATFLLVYAVQMTFNALAIATALWIAITMTDKLSGGHANPAVTTGVWLGNRHLHKWGMLLLYWLSQTIGGFIACFLTYGFSERMLPINPESHWQVQQFFLEVVNTCIFVTNVLICKDSKRNYTKDNFHLATIVAGTLFVVITIAGNFGYGACMNPAVGFTINISSLIFVQDMQMYRVWIWIVGQFIGGFLAGLLKRFFIDKAYDSMNSNGDPSGMFNMMSEFADMTQKLQS